MTCPTDIRKRFAANLRAARLRSGMSQEALADLTGMHRTEISLLERAQREPRLGTLLMLAAALEVRIAELVEGIAWEPATPASSPTGRYRVSPESS